MMTRRNIDVVSLIVAAKSNVPFKAIKYFAEWAYPYTKITVGVTNDLVKQYIGIILATLKEDIRIIFSKGSYSEFTLTFDGTPVFVEAEAVIIRVATKEFKF